MRRAPEMNVQEWLNTDHPIRQADLAGRVVVLYAFQMLCPGCVHHATPQIEKIQKKFADSDDVRVIGLHAVFEHHEVMTPEALRVYVHENRLSFPIGIDARDAGERIPKTMAAYDMQGTPTIILIDKNGFVRARIFGLADELDLGVAIGKLTAEPAGEQATGADLGADQPAANRGCSTS